MTALRFVFHCQRISGDRYLKGSAVVGARVSIFVVNIYIYLGAVLIGYTIE